jgi:hypothetical protein
MPGDSKEDLPRSLAENQNRDGGWGYVGGSSWTEPTVYALLAQSVEGVAGASFERGVRWLGALERSDGGWAPHPSVNQSTWVTALAVLLLGNSPGTAGAGKSVNWLLQQSGQESTLVFRIRRWLLGGKSDYEEQPEGWTWFPGTAAWVIPTSLSILALQKVYRSQPSGAIKKRVESGQAFLLSRTCRDGGWNHGSSRSLGYQAVSYPETTGIALLALHGVQSPRMAPALEVAARHFETCRSAEGFAWLKLGLLAHGKPVQGAHSPAPPRRIPDVALCLLADAAAGGKNVFLE